MLRDSKSPPIHCDREFIPLLEKVADTLDIKLNPTVTDDHVPEAERINRVIGERIRASYPKLPYMNLPKIMWRYLAMVCTHQLNLFPVKGGVSKYFSPYMILSGHSYDYEKHCQVHFCHKTNINAPRTIDAIYLRRLTISKEAMN